MIAIIPARGGSTRIPKKNIKTFHGKPIIAYSIQTAKESGLFDNIVVSTDDATIVEVARQYGADVFHRSKELARNEVGTQEVARDVLRVWSGEYVCVLYATAPLLIPNDLKRGLDLLKANPTFQYAFSVCTEPLYDAGGFYWGKRQAFLNDVLLFGERSIMVPIPTERVCDINTPEDWDRAEKLYTRMRHE